jgi:hypothetical protein
MQRECQVPECGLFEVILYIPNRAMLFSTCVYSSYSEDALENAEKEFSIHTLRHKLGAIRANAAFVIDRRQDRYYTKQNGRWRIESDRVGPFSAVHERLHFPDAESEEALGAARFASRAA